MRQRVVILIFLALSAGAIICEAQIPRARNADGTARRPSDREIRNIIMNGAFTTERTVCPRSCDFTTVTDAITYVAAQTRSISKQWTIKIYGGESNSPTANMNYSIGATTVPTWTTLQGAPGTQGSGAAINATPSPVIELTATAGTMLSFSEGSGCAGLNFYTNATLTANTVMARTTGADAVHLEGCQFWGNAAAGAFTFDILVTEATQTIGLNTSTVRGQNGSSANVRNVVVNSTTQLVLGRHQPGQGVSQAKVIEVLAGGLNLAWTRIVTGATVGLTVTGGSATNRFAVIPSYAGTVTTDLVYTPNGGTNPATCSIGQTFVNTTGAAEKWCSCTAANTWRCAALSAP